MNITNLPTEILEKIIVEGNCFTIFTVCKKWYEIANSIKHKFNEIIFDLSKDDPEKIKENPDQVFLYRSQMYDKQGIRIQKECLEKRNLVRLLNKFSSVHTLTAVFDILYYVKKQYIGVRKFKNLTKNVFTTNSDEFVGIINRNSYKTFLRHILDHLKKYKKINIKIKDYGQQIEKVDENIVINCEIKMLMELLSKFELIRKFEKFSFNAPNDVYIINDKDKEILIVRFGNYKKYDFAISKMKVFPYSCDCCDCCDCCEREYFLNCFSGNPKNENSKFRESDCESEDIEIDFEENEDNKNAKKSKSDVESDDESENSIYVKKSGDFRYSLSHDLKYPFIFLENEFEFLHKVKKLILINSEHIEYMFNMYLKLSRHNRSKQIKYICLDQEKSQNYSFKNFEFLALDKKTEDYSFDQIYLNYNKMFF